MIVYFSPSSPNGKVTVYIGYTPFPYLLTVSTCYRVNIDQAETEGHFHLFFAMLALETKYEFNGRRVSVDNSIRGDLLNAIGWFSLGYAEDREEMLLTAVKNTLTIRHINF